jgi:hypothetical protein
LESSLVIGIFSLAHDNKDGDDNCDEDHEWDEVHQWAISKLVEI